MDGKRQLPSKISSLRGSKQWLNSFYEGPSYNTFVIKAINARVYKDFIEELKSHLTEKYIADLPTKKMQFDIITSIYHYESLNKVMSEDNEERNCQKLHLQKKSMECKPVENSDSKMEQ